MKKIITLALILIAAILALPAAVFATSPSAAMTFGMMQVEYRFAEGETPNIPQEIERFGYTYHLVSQTDPVRESTLPATRTYTFNISGVLSLEQLTDAGIDSTDFTPKTVPMEREVDMFDIQTVGTNEVEGLRGSTKVFTVFSDENPDGVEVEGTFTGVTFEVTKDDSGLPTEYLRTAVYRGIEPYTAIGYFIGSSTYRTDTTEGVDLFVIVATYETDQMPPPIVSNVGTLVAGGDTGGDEGLIDGLTTIEEQQVALQAGEGNPLVNIMNGRVPLGNMAVTALWSFFSLCFSIAAVALAVWFVFGLIAKRKKEKKDLRDLILRIMVAGFGFLTLFTWLLWDDFSLGMVWVNQYTLLIGILLAVTAAIAVITKVLQSKTEEDE